MRRKRTAILFGSLTLIGAACDATPTNDFLEGKEPIPPLPAKDSGTPEAGPMPDAGMTCTPTPPADCAGGPVVDPCSTPAGEGTGSIKGVVTVPAAIMPLGGKEAKGDLFISVLPALDIAACAGKGPAAVATAIIHCVDLTGGKAVPFEVLGVPPRSEAWVVSPYLDTNRNALDLCDLFGFGPVKVEMAGQATKADISFTANGNALAGQQMACGYKGCE